MTDSMKFGPEWLRNLSGDNCNSGGSGGGTANLITPRYQLAEHRYGREEMLALFDRTCKPPEALASLQTLYVEKTQLPLAFIPMTEDETRVWSTGFSSSSSTGIRGRGGSVDRGGRVRTGRGGGGMYSSHFSRGIGFDDTGDGGSSSRLDSQSYQGRRIFDRSQSERGWSERNGISADTGGGEWNGSTSPRKELTRGPSGSSLMENNWRRHRGVTAGDGEDEGWRVASNNRGSEKWVRGNWRDGGGLSERDRMDRGDNDGEDNRGSSSSGGGGGGGGGNNSGGRWETRTSHHRLSQESSHHHPPPRTARTWESNHHDNHDNLPEWATENPSESGGSFDASGAFHGGILSDDENEEGSVVSNTGANQEGRTRRISEGNNNPSSKAAGNKLGSYGQNVVVHNNSSLRNSSSSGVTRERLKSLHPFDDDDEKIRINQNRKSISPTKQHSAVILNSSALKTTDSTTTVITANTAIKKVQTSASSTNLAKSESTKIQGPQRSKSFIDKPLPPTKSSQESSVSTSKPKPVGLSSIVIPQPVPVIALPSSKPEDDLDRMNEEADMLVAKLTADEEGHHREDASTIAAASITNHQSQHVSSTAQQEKWFYRDPQGEVQGPFLANEMAEWCRAGYFTPGLLVRRTCDERYATLGDLMTMCGRVPFIPGPPIPPLKLTEQVISPSISNTAAAVPTGLPGSALPKPGIEDPLLVYQYQQLRLLHNQQVLLRQMKNSAITKLSQASDHFATLSAVEQNQLIMQCVMQDPEIRELSLNQSPFINPVGQTATTNPVMQLFNQMQQAKTQNENHLNHSNPHPSAGSVHPGGTAAATAAAIDPIQQFIQKIGSNQNLPVPSQSSINPSPSQPSPHHHHHHHHHQDDNNPIKSLLRQLYVNANGHPQSHQMDSIWPLPPSQHPPPPPPPPQINAQFNAQNWLAQVGPLPPMPPPGGPPPNSLWELQAKEMKTEQQILEEQNIKMIQEDRKKEEQLIRRQEELLLRQVEDETAKRKLEAAAAAEHARQLEESKRKEEEKMRKEEEKRRKEEEKRKQEEEMKKKEEKKRKEDDRKREEKRKLDEENNRKKQQEEEKKKREEAKRQEEKLKKEEDRRKKLEEEQQQQKRQEEQERLKREEEIRKKQEHAAEEQAKRAAEQRRREAEALKKLQERSKAPWAQTQHLNQSVTTQAAAASLVDIQRLEREKKAEEIRIQQQLQQQLAQQKAIEAAREAAAVTDSSKRLQFKWAEKAAPTNTKPQVKSLAQIQQEEQERISKIKQQEKERQEKANQKEAAVVMQNAGIWGTASQSLSWAATSGQNSGSETKVNNKTWAASGFWDEPPITIPQKNVRISKPQHVKSTPQPAPKAPAVTSSNASVVTQPQQQNINHMKTTKSKVNKKEEAELVKKLFENNTVNTADDFTQWCYRTLCGLQSSVDIPTFIGFLRDIEAAYEVKEYVRMYLGDSKQTTEFTKQFLEKRSKLRSAQRPRAEADDLCKPAPAVNPNAPTEFQEVKGKSKKPKKGKMCKVDSRILGFSVTAATDRINVGDRDYGEGV